MRCAVIALAALASACKEPAPVAVEPLEAEPALASASTEGPGKPADSASGSDSLPGVATLSGEWRVAAIDGIAYDESVGLALSGDETEIWWEPRCAGHIHPYKIEGFAFSSGQSDGPPSAAPDSDLGVAPAPIVCAIGLPPRLDQVGRAIHNATRIERTEQNGVLLSGGGHSLLLFSQ